MRLIALVGAHMANRFADVHKFNYTDPEFTAAFDETVARYDELVKHYTALVEGA